MKQIPRRLLHVLQSPSTSIPTSLNVSHLVKNTPELREGPVNSTTFEVLDSRVLKVGLAPSTELYTKKNTLIASFGDSLVSTFYFTKALARLWAFQRPFGYQKLVSFAPVSALISSSRPLSVLTLDGTIDWVLVSNQALHTFTGERLIVEAKSKPWFRRGPGFSHTFLSGRGQVALAATGSNLYKVTLQEGESFLALKDTLVAYSVDSNNKNVFQPEYHHLPNSTELKVDDMPPVGGWEHVKNVYRLASDTVKHFIHADSGRYVKIRGPTTMLLQSPPNSFVAPQIEHNLNVNPLEQKIGQTARQVVDESARELEVRHNMGMMGKPEDHLKVATVKDGKVVFESTSNFDRFL